MTCSDRTSRQRRAAVLEGLLGAADGDFTNDLRMPDGTIVDPVRASAVDSEFSVAWRVDESTSLFDCEAGESLRTINVATPQAPPVVIADEALATCADALGPDAVSHEVSSCAYDVSVTGDVGYVDAYVEVVDERVDTDENSDLGEEKPRLVPTGDAVPGEVYFWLPFGGEHEVIIQSDSENPAFVSVEVFVDAEPTIIDADEVADSGPGRCQSATR